MHYLGDLNDPAYRFGWQTYAQGRIRFAGSNFGGDEQGHEMIAVDLDGEISYGEIAPEWPDPDHYGLVVLSMGWVAERSVGAPFYDRASRTDAIRVFTNDQAERIAQLVLQIVTEFVPRTERPYVLSNADVGYTGSLRFAPGWCYVGD